MEGRGKSRRRSPYRVWKRRGSALLAVLLTLSLMLGDISGLSRVVMAGQGTVREEFRIHREDILKAAEEAIENGEPLSEPLAITSEEEKTEEKYQEILPADGSVYEIFPDIEQVKEVDSLELRIFIRLAEGADPASYTLTGDETLVFLYVNGGDVTAEGRVNIDGYVSEFTEVAAFESEEEPMQPRGDTGAVPGNGAAGSGKGSGNGAAGGSGTAGSEAVGSSDAENDTAAAESESNGSDSMDPEDSAADLDGETEAESEEVGNGTSEDGMSPEETLPTETQEPSQEPESGAAEETEAAEQPSGETPDDETPGDQTDGSEADGTASDENTAEAGTGSADEDKETAGNTENSDAADDSADNENDVKESDAADEASEADEGSAEDNSQADPADTENENAEVDKEDGAEPEKSDTAENADSNAADADNEAGSTVTLSLRNIQKVAASLASPSEAETPEADESQEEQEETEADEEDSYYEDNGDPVDEEDAAETEDEEDIFKKTHDLKGRKYDEAVLDETVAIRAFAAGMEDAGFNREDLLEGAHQLTYTVAEGEAKLIYTPEYVRDEAVVTFGIIPAEGMEVYQVTANGEALAETEETAAIASASEAKRAKASSSDADYDEERAVYYQIPQVLEDQTVEIQVLEEGYNSHPAFRKSKTFDNGVTVTVSAEEGILPAGTELQVEEVTEQVADAVAQKIEDSAEDSSKSVTSIIAYDINLIWNGEKLSNDWSKNGLVNVTFTGEPIEKLTDEAEKVEIFAIDDQEKEELSAQNADSISPETLILEPIQEEDVSGKATATVSYQAEHFTIYVISGTGGSGEAVSKYTMQVGDTITVYSDEMTYSDWYTSWSWKTNESGTGEVTIDEGSRRVNGVLRPEAEITAIKEGSVTVTVSTRLGWQTITDSFIIHIDPQGPKTVTFNGNGATGNVPDAITNINPGTEITLPDADNLRKNGYSFIGWSKEQTTDETKIGQGKVVIYPAGSEILVNESFTLYAIWVVTSPEVPVHFFIRLDGTIQNEPSNEKAGAYTGHYFVRDDKGNLTGKVITELEGMYFKADQNVLKEAKFVTDPTGEAVEANLNKLPSDEAIVEAINLYSDTIESNYGKVGKITFEDYQKEFRVLWYVVKLPENGLGDGYWHVDGVLLKKDKVTLAYDLNCVDYSSGSKTPSGGSYGKGELVTVAGNDEFSRPGYEFIGWNTAKDGTGDWYQPNASITMEKDTVLYAQWQNATAGLVLRKELEGENGDVTQVSFSLYKATADWEKDGDTPLKSEIHPTTNGIISIPLAHDAENNQYLLYEDETASNYLKLTEPVKITVSFDSNNRITYRVEGSNKTYSAGDPYTIINYSADIDFAIHKVLVDGKNGIDNVGQVSFQLLKFDETSNGYREFGSPVFVVATEQDSISGHATFEEIPLGEYQLVELTTADGYVLYEPIDLKVTEAGDGSVILQVKEDSGWITVNNEKIMPVYTVNNERGVELPETGGPGLIMMERFGWMLLLLAMTGAEIQLLSRKRRKDQ